MSIGLLFPAALMAFAALALPLLIHLTRRSERQLMAFAALRWLRAKERARRRLRIDEWLLLILRLLLLAAVILLLAQPVLHGTTDQRAWVVVVPGADPSTLAIEPELRDASWHWLAPGFPDIGQTLPHGPIPTASLLRELDATLAAAEPLTVVVPEQLAGLDAERIRLSRDVNWRIVASNAAAEEAQKPDRVTRQVAIRVDPDYAAISRYFRAAVIAWNIGNALPGEDSSPNPDVLDVTPATGLPPTHADSLLWLSSAPLPPTLAQWLADGGTVLRAQSDSAAPDDHGVELWHSAQSDTWLSAQRNGNGRLLIVHGPLDVEHLPEVLNPDFPTLLRSWLSPPMSEPAKAMAKDSTPTRGIAAWTTDGTPLRGLMIWLIAALWLLERVFASNRRAASRI